MKQKYEKPLIFSENFEIEDMVCSTCGTKALFAQSQCPVKIPGLGTVFNDETGCSITIDIDICYHVAIPGENIFSSGF